MKTEEWIEELVQTADNGQRYVLRDDITELLIDETALLVGEAVTQDWNDGLIRNWIASKNSDVFPLTDDLPPETIEGMNYNCSISDEAQKKIDAFEQENPVRPDGTKNYFNWGVLDWDGREIVAFSDIDRYACKYWDYCEEAVYIDLQEKHNMKIIDNLDDLQ
jgi:hypothetical protein